MIYLSTKRNDKGDNVQNYAPSCAALAPEFSALNDVNSHMERELLFIETGGMKKTNCVGSSGRGVLLLRGWIEYVRNMILQLLILLFKEGFMEGSNNK